MQTDTSKDWKLDRLSIEELQTLLDLIRKEDRGEEMTIQDRVQRRRILAKAQSDESS